MKKILTFVIAALFGMGLYAQTPDNPVVVCEVPSTLDSLRGETPVCPALGTPTVALNESTKKVQFSVPITGGTSFDGVQGHFTVTIDGVNGSFLVTGTFNSSHTILTGSVSVNGDNAMSGLDLRDRTLHAAAVLTGCHAADAQDPTSSDGVVSETVIYTVPAECLFVFGTSSYQRQNNGNFSFRANFSGSANAISNQRFIIQNADGNTVAMIPGNIIGNAITAMVGVSAMTTTYGLTVGSYTAIPTVDPVYASCPSTGQPMSFEILPACTAFDSVVVYTDGQQYQLRAYINLTGLETRNPSFDITATTGQSPGGTGWYVDASRQFLATPMTALPTQQTVLQTTASVEARCGVDLVNDGYVTLTSASATLTVPMACPAFYNTEDNLSGGSYRMLSHINLTGGYDYQQAHFVVKTGAADSTSVAATYTSSSLEMATAWISTTQNFPWANQTITLYPVVEVKCGLHMGGYVTVTGPAISRSFASCPTVGDVYLTSNQATNPTLRADTLFAEIEHYTSSLVHRVVFSVTRIGSSTTLQWEADGWNVAHGAAYKVLTLAQLQQLGLSTTDIVATVDVTMEVNANSVGCSNSTVTGSVVTLTALTECPAFAAAAVTTVEQDYDGSITVKTPVQHYNPDLIYHTGVTGQDSLYYTIYVNTSGTDQPGSEMGTMDAVYNPQSQMMTFTIPYNQLTPGARYDFVPHINLTGYCNPASSNYITIEGPSGTRVCTVYCPTYSQTTNAVRNADGSVTVTHQMLNYNQALLRTNSPLRVYGYDSTGAQRINTTSNITINQDGLLTCTIPASSFTQYPSHNMTFVPRVYLSTAYCTQLTYGPISNPVCIPYSNLPSFTAESNSDGMGKVNLFTNEGVILTSKIVNYTSYSTKIAQAGYLLSRSPITEYSADKAVLGTMGSSTGDTLSYKVGMDSCGGVTYYRPYLIMKGCDPQIVLGEQHSFEMWAPDLTVSADPTHVAAGGSVTLSAVATMTVGSWDQNTSYGVPCENVPSFANNCGIPYPEDCSTTKNMELWMYLLIGLRNCPNFWNSFSGIIISALGMDPGIADFQYRWEQNGTVIFSTTAPGQAGVTTVNPTATTTYTGVSDFSYNGVHCVQKANVTVQVP